MFEFVAQSLDGLGDGGQGVAVRIVPEKQVADVVHSDDPGRAGDQ